MCTRQSPWVTPGPLLFTGTDSSKDSRHIDSITVATHVPFSARGIFHLLGGSVFVMCWWYTVMQGVLTELNQNLRQIKLELK